MLGEMLAPTVPGGAVCMPDLVRDGEGDAKRRQILVAFGKCLDEFRRINPTMPVAQMQAFLLAVITDELSMSEIAQKTGMKVSTTSRYLIDLGLPRHDADTAYGLIERSIDPMEPRRARYLMTRKSKALINRLVTTLLSICEDCEPHVDIPGNKRR